MPPASQARMKAVRMSERREESPPWSSTRDWVLIALCLEIAGVRGVLRAAPLAPAPHLTGDFRNLSSCSRASLRLTPQERSSSRHFKRLNLHPHVQGWPSSTLLNWSFCAALSFERFT